MDQNINTGLVLGLNYGSGSSSMLPLTMNHHRRREPSLRLERSSSNCVSLETSLTLGLSDGVHEPVAAGKHGDRRALRLLEPDGRQPSPDYSAMTSSFSDGRPARVKKESDETDSEEAEKGLSQISHELLEEGNGRKKLRLTKEQSALLEDKFKEQSTLNPRQKQILAKQLKLQPRQVEVWFQNRRARTKFKQTKVDCEVLRKCCEALRAENRRLQKELKALKLSRQLYMQPPSGAGNYTVCPSCESITAVAGDDAGAGRALAVASKPGFFKPFAHSAAC